MDKRKLFIGGLTVASFLAAGALPHPSFAGEETDEAKKMEGKKGSCSGAGGCGAMKDEAKDEAKEEAGKTKEGSCSGMKDEGEKKEEGKKGSCTAMKE